MKIYKLITMNEEYLPTKEVRKILGVTTNTLINWDKAGKIRTNKTPSGQRLYCKQDVYTIAGIDKIAKIKKCYCYCRVSSKKQMGDLKRQQDLFKSKYPNHILVTDVGSGINWKRKGLKTILEQAMSGNVAEVVVAHRDRLCRFAFDIIEWVITHKGAKLTVLHDDNHKSENSELADDIMSIVHVYSCRQMGKRRYKDTDKSEKDKDLSEQETEINV